MKSSKLKPQKVETDSVPDLSPELAAMLAESGRTKPLPLPSDEECEINRMEEEDNRFFEQFDEFGFLKKGYLDN